MSATFVLKSVWLFILGAVLALIGMYTLLTRPDMGSNPFIIMLMGLFFTGTGSIYGKKKLREGEPMVSSPDAGQIPATTQAPQGAGVQQAGTQPQSPTEEFLESAEDATEEEVVRQAPEKSREPAARPGQPPQQTSPAQQPASPAQQPAPAKTGDKAEAKVIKIMVCPKCGAENQPTDKFCYNCGKKLKPDKKKSRKKTKKKSSPKEPPKDSETA